MRYSATLTRSRNYSRRVVIPTHSRAFTLTLALTHTLQVGRPRCWSTPRLLWPYLTLSIQLALSPLDPTARARMPNARSRGAPRRCSRSAASPARYLAHPRPISIHIARALSPTSRDTLSWLASHSLLQHYKCYKLLKHNNVSTHGYERQILSQPKDYRHKRWLIEDVDIVQ